MLLGLVFGGKRSEEGFDLELGFTKQHVRDFEGIQFQTLEPMCELLDIHYSAEKELRIKVWSPETESSM